MAPRQWNNGLVVVGDRIGCSDHLHEIEIFRRCCSLAECQRNVSKKGHTYMSSGDNLVLYVAAYSDATSAQADFQSLKDAEGDDFKVEGAVVMSRDADGNVDVLESGDGTTPRPVRGSVEASAWSSVCSLRRCSPRPRSVPVSVPCWGICRRSMKRRNSASNSTSTSRRTRRPLLLSSTTSTSTVLRLRWWTRTSGSTRQSARTTTTSSRKAVSKSQDEVDKAVDS